MKRYNIFNQIHKGLRALLYDTALKLQQTDFADPEQTRTISIQVQTVLDLFEGHAHTEDNFILPKIATYEPSVSDAFEKEHVEDMAIAARVASLLKMVGNAHSIAAAQESGLQLTISFIDFMVFNLEHMKQEEIVLNNLLWRYYSDEELHALTREIVASIPAEKMAITSKWMMRGLANDEIVRWLQEIRNSAPPFVFESMTGLAIGELGEARWQSIQKDLFGTWMVA